MEQLNKLQLKAEILTVLATLKSHFDAETANDTLETLRAQEDKDSIFDILMKELSKANESKVITICFVLLQLFEQKKVEDAFWEMLKSPKISDVTKTILLNLLKDLGNKIEYETLEQCFDNPEGVIDEDTKRLLQSAVINPEAQIDFLDFISSLDDNDKDILVKSLGDDYSSDNLANILNPLVMYNPDSEIALTAIDILGGTKSQLALYTLKEVSNFEISDVTRALVKKNISKLKISGVREENAIEFYQSILQSQPYDSYASYPDGHGNQAIIFSREREDELIQMVAVVINDTYGIIDCFGFYQITKNEFERIVDKFYKYDERIYLDPHVIKTILDNAEKLTRKQGETVPYEYLCWKSFLSDITPEVMPLDMIMSAKIETKSLDKNDFDKICMLDLVQKWFFESGDNDEFDSIVSDLEEKIKNDDYSFDLEKIVQDNTEKVFSKSKALLDKRILMSAYLGYLTGKKLEAQMLFSLFKDEKMKFELQKNILRKSFYEYYVALSFKLKEEKKTTNIFALRNKKKITELSQNQIAEMISKIEGLWVNG